MLRKTLTNFALILILSSSTPALAAFGKIISQDEAVEADGISVSWDAPSGKGTAKITGCNQCPLRLKLDKKTEFLHNGLPVKLIDINKHSGKSGTAVYDAESEQAIKILW